MTEKGFRVVSFKEFRRMRVSEMRPKPKVVFVNKRRVFTPPGDTLQRYKEMMRRYKGHPRQREFALIKSNYDGNFRRRMVRDSDSLAALRKLSEISKDRLVLLVMTEDRPDAGILVSIARRLYG